MANEIIHKCKTDTHVYMFSFIRVNLTAIGLNAICFCPDDGLLDKLKTGGLKFFFQSRELFTENIYYSPKFSSIIDLWFLIPDSVTF